MRENTVAIIPFSEDWMSAEQMREYCLECRISQCNEIVTNLMNLIMKDAEKGMLCKSYMIGGDRAPEAYQYACHVLHTLGFTIEGDCSRGGSRWWKISWA